MRKHITHVPIYANVVPIYAMVPLLRPFMRFCVFFVNIHDLLRYMTNQSQKNQHHYRAPWYSQKPAHSSHYLHYCLFDSHIRT